MKRILYWILFLAAFKPALSQNIDKIINATEADRIERILSADEMQGRIHSR
jgi:hypothetical protein